MAGHSLCGLCRLLRSEKIWRALRYANGSRKALLRKIREKHGDHNGTAFWLPVLIVSGFAREVDGAVDVMKDGASDVIQKPPDSRQVSERIRQALQASGRETHERCHEPPPAPRTNLKDGLVIAIPGDRIGRRTRVTIASKPVDVTDSSLKVLLHLMVARRKEGRVNKVDLGATADQGFKGISILRNELKAVLAGVDITAVRLEVEENELVGVFRWNWRWCR
jgi:hypothetical protein